MSIVADSQAKEYRLFFLTEEQTESFFDLPGEDWNSTSRRFVPPRFVIAAETLLSLSAVMIASITTAAYAGFLPLTVPGVAVIIESQILRSMPTLLVVVGLIQCVIQLAALVLVFMPASRMLFRQSPCEYRCAETLPQ